MGFMSILKAISDYGFLIVAGAGFIWYSFSQSKSIKKSQEEDRKLYINMNEKMLATFEKSIDNTRQDTLQFNKSILDEMKNLQLQFNNLGEKFNHTIECVYSEMDMTCEKVTNVLREDKILTDLQAEPICKGILREQIMISADFVLDKVSKNNLEVNKSIISKEIYSEFKDRFQEAINLIDRLPYKNEVVKQNLYKFYDNRMEKIYQDIIKIMDVNGSYDRNYLEKEVRVIRDDFITDINRFRLN